MLLSFGLQHLNWRQTDLLEFQTHMLQLVLLLSGFASQGADFHRTVLLAFHVHSTDCWKRRDMNAIKHRLCQFPEGNSGNVQYSDKDRESVLCVVALQAATVIQRMLVNLLKTDLSRDGIDEDHSDLESALSFLRQRCQKYDYGSSDRIIGFLQPCGDLDDMPYRQVSDQDSANLIEMVLACIFESRANWQDLDKRCLQVIMRSPFSNIGLRDYLKDRGYFDELAADKLLSEYQEGM